jgi:hypothetical protein
LVSKDFDRKAANALPAEEVAEEAKEEAVEAKAEA